MTRNAVDSLFQIVKHMQLFHQEKMQNHGKTKKAGSLDRNELLKTVKRLGKSGLDIIDAVWSRPRCIASNLTKLSFSGDNLSARNFDSQVNEVHARVAVLNKLTELGRHHTQVVT